MPILDLKSQRLATILGLAMPVLAGFGCFSSTTTPTVAVKATFTAPMPAQPDAGIAPELVESARGLAYRVEPVGEPAEDGPSALDVWRSLLSGIESDPETSASLSKLFAGWPVQIQRLDGPGATDEKLRDNPDDAHKFVIRLASLGAENEGPGGSRRLVGSVAFGMASRHQVADPNNPQPRMYGYVPASPTGPAPLGDVNPGRTFWILAEDYLIRRQPGWRLVAVDAEETEKPPADPEQRRAALDQTIAQFSKAVRERFGTPDQPKADPKVPVQTGPEPSNANGGSDTP